MIRSIRRLPTTLLVAALALGATSCGNPEVTVGVTKVKQLEREGLVPTEILGLAVAQEPLPEGLDGKRTYVDSVGLYSFREGNQLQATMQVSHFTKDSDHKSAKFRASVVAQVGSVVPKAFRMGDETIYLTSGRKQTIAVWFREDYLFLMNTREEYETPRSLVRAVLEEVKP